MQALGSELERLRIARNIKSIAELARRAKMSDNRLGEIIRAYKDPRGFTVPNDDTLERLATALDVPVSRFHAILGRFPDVPLPDYYSPDTKALAAAYDVLPDYGKKLVRDAVKSVQETVASIDGQAASQ